MKKVMFVCHGNICRSPMAEFIFKDIVKKANKHDYIISSTATSSEEIGNNLYYEARNILNKNNIPYQDRAAKRITIKDYQEYDYIIVMDENNYRNIMRIIKIDTYNKVNKLLKYCDTYLYEDISDPWYTRDFDKAYNDIYRGCLGLFKYIENKHEK